MKLRDRIIDIGLFVLLLTLLVIIGVMITPSGCAAPEAATVDISGGKAAATEDHQRLPTSSIHRETITVHANLNPPPAPSSKGTP